MLSFKSRNKKTYENNDDNPGLSTDLQQEFYPNLASFSSILINHILTFQEKLYLVMVENPPTPFCFTVSPVLGMIVSYPVMWIHFFSIKNVIFTLKLPIMTSTIQDANCIKWTFRCLGHLLKVIIAVIQISSF